MKARELLSEVEERDIGYYNPQEDDLSRAYFTDKHKPKLTLRQLNRLKKIRVTRKADHTKEQDLLNVMYSIPNETSAEGGL